MCKTIPQWADPEVSSALDALCSQGEGQKLEFKRELSIRADSGNRTHPDSVKKELAALATSGGGKVLFGVDNSGKILGLPNADDDEEHDKLLQWIHQVLRDMNPRPSATVGLAVSNGSVVLVVSIAEEQAEPLYYSGNVPYVRDGSISRPAGPDEVKSFVWAHPSAEHARKMQDLKYEQARRLIPGLVLGSNG